jgi:hypothetical protein
MGMVGRTRERIGRLRARAVLILVVGCSSEHATTLAQGPFPWGIAVDASYVYWVNAEGADGGSVVRVAKGGGAAQTLASAQVNPVSIAIDANRVYWTTAGTSSCAPDGACTSNADGAVLSAPLAGGTPTVVAGGQRAPVSLAVDASNVYFVDEGSAVFESTIADGTVVQVPVGGGAPTTLAGGLFYPGALAVDGASVYWTIPGAQGVSGSVLKVPIGGGAVTTLASGWPSWDLQTGGSTIPDLIAVDATSVYWVTGNIDGAGAKIMKVPTGGGTPSTLGSVQSEFTTLAVDATTLYWTDGNSFVRLPLPGGSPTSFAQGEAPLEPGGIALDATTIYWTDPMAQSIKSTPK